MNPAGGPQLDAARIRERLPTRVLGQGRDGIRILEQTTSTNQVLGQTVLEGTARVGQVLLAERQTAGRGRADHGWASPPGGLYLSLLWSPSLAPERYGLLTLASGVAVSDLCRGLGLRPTLRWPNDVLLRGRKVAGVLCELVLGPDPARFVVVGIGLNVSQPLNTLPPEVAALATTLRRELGARDEEHGTDRLDRCRLAAQLLERVELRLQEAEQQEAELRGAWTSLWGDRQGLLETVAAEGAVLRGRGGGIAPDGALLLVTAAGETVRVEQGTVRPVRADAR